MAIEITVRDEPDGVRIVVAGEVDLATGHELERAILRAEDRAATIVLDLAAVDFFDSTGLQILLDADVRARDGAHRFVVAAGDGEAARVIELTQVASRFSSAVVE